MLAQLKDGYRASFVCGLAIAPQVLVAFYGESCFRLLEQHLGSAAMFASLILGLMIFFIAGPLWAIQFRNHPWLTKAENGCELEEVRAWKSS